MRLWVSDFGGVNDEEREMERWRLVVASKLWTEVGGGVIVGVDLWMWVGGFVGGGRDGGWWLVDQR